MSIVWPCLLTVEEYASAGRRVEVPRPDCPGCSGRVVFWAGYWRHVRLRGRCRKVFVPRVRCRVCRATHALLPAFALARRLDAAEGVGGVIVEVAGGRGVRPAAARAQVPHTTARGWVRRFAARSGELAVSFSALAAELGSSALVRPAEPPARLAAAAIGEAFAAAAALPGWAALGPWRFASAVTGGSLIAANASSPFLIVGRRRFMPPRSP